MRRRRRGAACARRLTLIEIRSRNDYMTVRLNNSGTVTLSTITIGVDELADLGRALIEIAPMMKAAPVEPAKPVAPAADNVPF